MYLTTGYATTGDRKRLDRILKSGNLENISLFRIKVGYFDLIHVYGEEFSSISSFWVSRYAEI